MASDFCRVLLARTAGRNFVLPESKGVVTVAPSLTAWDHWQNQIEEGSGHVRPSNAITHRLICVSVEDSNVSMPQCQTVIWQNWLFYLSIPEGPRISVSKNKAGGARTGGRPNSKVPRGFWKYAWIDTIFGTTLRQRARYGGDRGRRMVGGLEMGQVGFRLEAGEIYLSRCATPCHPISFVLA